MSVLIDHVAPPLYPLLDTYVDVLTSKCPSPKPSSTKSQTQRSDWDLAWADSKMQRFRDFTLRPDSDSTPKHLPFSSFAQIKSLLILLLVL